MSMSERRWTVTLFPWQHMPADHSIPAQNGNHGAEKICDHFKDSYFTFEMSDTTVPVYIKPFNMSSPTDGSLAPLCHNCDTYSKTCYTTESEISVNADIDSHMQINKDCRRHDQNSDNSSDNLIGEPAAHAHYSDNTLISSSKDLQSLVNSNKESPATEENPQNRACNS